MRQRPRSLSWRRVRSARDYEPAADFPGIETLETNLSQLSAANTTLDAEVADLMRRVASGEYNPATERPLELRDNPASRAHAVRTQQLEELRAENAALLARLKDVDHGVPGSEGVSLVPRESYDRLLKEKEELVASHEKRLQRLKEVSQLGHVGKVRC